MTTCLLRKTNKQRKQKGDTTGAVDTARLLPGPGQPPHAGAGAGLFPAGRPGSAGRPGLAAAGAAAAAAAG